MPQEFGQSMEVERERERAAQGEVEKIMKQYGLSPKDLRVMADRMQDEEVQRKREEEDQKRWFRVYDERIRGLEVLHDFAVRLDEGQMRPDGKGGWIDTTEITEEEERLFGALGIKKPEGRDRQFRSNIERELRLLKHLSGEMEKRPDLKEGAQVSVRRSPKGEKQGVVENDWEVAKYFDNGVVRVENGGGLDKQILVADLLMENPKRE